MWTYNSRLGVIGTPGTGPKKILGTDEYRVPTSKTFLGTDGFRVPGKFSELTFRTQIFLE